MEIKNLAQLKRAIQNRHSFVIVRHYIRPDFEGQTRQPSTVQTNGFYSVIHGDPSHPVSQFNGGRGSWLEYGKAGDWEFSDGLCKLFNRDRCPVWEIRFVD